MPPNQPGYAPPQPPTFQHPVTPTPPTPEPDKSRVRRLIMALLALAVLIGIGVSAFMLLNASPDDTQSTQQTDNTTDPSDTPTQGGSSLQINQRNTERRNDAAKLTGASYEFMMNNQAELPSDYSEGSLTGAPGSSPAPVTFGFYRQAQVAQREHPPLAEDGLVLVTGATCDETSGAAVAGTSRQIAVLYALENRGGAWTPRCQGD